MPLENLGKLSEKKFVDTSWDFRNENTKYGTHGYHTYPAMMIPQIARRLIEKYGAESKVLLDPFMGSGTALVEGALHPQFETAYGIDINPLALLIGKVKTTAINPQTLWNKYHCLINSCIRNKQNIESHKLKIEPPSFFNINFWFNPDVIIDLAIIKKNIENIKDKDIKDFFLIAFSETVRNVSNTRKREYKLYRMDREMLKKHKPDALEEFRNKLKDNIYAMKEFEKTKKKCQVQILKEDTRLKTSIPDNSVDLIVTSPPYGDSRTTVAYGQFSRLALQWLGYETKETNDIDKVSLGGIPTKDLG
ncbi:MAG: DNA methyltransferase, partial [Nanoarchaeota archaeon]|nr:DNA methyltransferase [Nanoarchaeota archaeon]